MSDQHYINMANPNAYPEFYEFTNSYDKFHFNESGANYFTISLALLMKDKLSLN